MALNTQGPWGSGGGQGPWGGGPSRPQPPDIEELLRRSQDRFKRFLPGGKGGARRISILVGAAVLIWLATGFYVVQPEEEGVALLFGKLFKKSAPGLSYNLPSPIGEIIKPKVTRINRVQVGFRGGTGGASSTATNPVPAESLMLTGDENIIDIQFVTLWRIRDSQRYLFNIRNPDATVKDASESAMRAIMGKTEFEYARTQGRVEIEQEARELIQKILDDWGSGILVSDVQLQKIDPPGNVLDAFRDVQAARADKERAVNEGTAYRNEIVERAQGEAARIVNDAEAFKAERIAVATGEASRFLAVLQQYRGQKEVTRQRIYLDTMKSVFGGMDKVLIENSPGGSGVVPYLPLPEIEKRRGGASQ
jgi:membrane protease subunit HflK